MIRRIALILSFFGFDVKKFIYSFRGIPKYIENYLKMKTQLKVNKDFSEIVLYPCLNDRFSKAGSMTGQYFNQDYHVAKKIFDRSPENHVDIGSRIDGFVAHIACFRTIEVFDIRKLNSHIKNIVFKQVDCSSKTFDLVNYCDSISSLHAIEHFGLGRYGDEVDLNAYHDALLNIHRALKPNGIFYFSVPIGRQRIEFDGHRIFSLSYLIDILADTYTILEFSYVDDKGDFFQNISLNNPAQVKSNFNCNFGLAIFELRKLENTENA